MDATPSECREDQQTPSSAPLQRDEWDFRSVRKSELMTALLYEYTRSSRSTCRAIVRWQSQKFDLTCLEGFKKFDDNEMLGRTAREIPDITNAQVVDLTFDPNGSSGTAEAKDHLSFQLELSGEGGAGPRFRHVDRSAFHTSGRALGAVAKPRARLSESPMFTTAASRRRSYQRSRPDARLRVSVWLGSDAGAFRIYYQLGRASR